MKDRDVQQDLTDIPSIRKEVLSHQTGCITSFKSTQTPRLAVIFNVRERRLPVSQVLAKPATEYPPQWRVLPKGIQ